MTLVAAIRPLPPHELSSDRQNVRYVMADYPVKLTVTVSREKYEVQATAAMTWADVLSTLAEQRGSDACDLRLLHKGKMAVPTQTLLAASVKDGTKLIAMKTAGQHRKEKNDASRAAAETADKSAERMRASSATAGTSSGALAPASSIAAKRVMLGDDVDEEDSSQFYVRVSHGPRTYRILFPSEAAHSATLRDLKLRLEGLAQVQLRQQRIIFAGKRDMPDDTTLADGMGAKRGAVFILMFSSKQHDAVEAMQNIGLMTTQTKALGVRVEAVERKVRGRLLSDYAELTLAIGELEGEVERLSGNVEAVSGQAGGCSSADRAVVDRLSTSLADMSVRVASLRAHAVATLKR
jgi:Ubiquitin family